MLRLSLLHTCGMSAQHREIQRFARFRQKIPGRKAAAFVHAAQSGHALHDLRFGNLSRLQKARGRGALSPDDGQQDVACACLGLPHFPRDDQRLVEHFCALARKPFETILHGVTHCPFEFF